MLPFFILVDPDVIGDVSLLFENGVITLDWSQTFQLNGILMHYDLRRNGVLLSRNLATSVTLTQEPLEIGWCYINSVSTAHVQ